MVLFPCFNSFYFSGTVNKVMVWYSIKNDTVVANFFCVWISKWSTKYASESGPGFNWMSPGSNYAKSKNKFWFSFLTKPTSDNKICSKTFLVFEILVLINFEIQDKIKSNFQYLRLSVGKYLFSLLPNLF